MSGFCGWMGRPDLGLPAEETIAHMTARLPAYGPVRVETSAAPRGALSMSTAPQAGSWFQQSTLSAVIEGYPRWTDAELARIAGRDGHAAALLHGFREYGEKLLQKLQGDFALAVIDVAAQRGLLAIDRSGIRTLCVSENAPGLLVFGTTTDSVRAFPGMDSLVGAQTISDYLFFVDRIPAPKTAFRGLTKLVPGEYLLFDKGQVRRDSYWRLPAEQDHQRDIDDFSSELFERMRAAISRNIANEPADTIGAFLSGGLDSSTVVGLLAKAIEIPPKSFTIGFDIDAFDETEFARIAVNRFGARQHEYSVTPEDVFDAIPKIAAIYDEPFANASAVPVYFCAKIAKDAGVDIMLAGDGGDELFAGNTRYVDDRVFDHYGRVPAFLRRFLIEPFIDAFARGDTIPLLRKARNYTAIANMSIPGRITRTNVYTSMKPAEIFNQSVLE